MEKNTNEAKKKSQSSQPTLFNLGEGIDLKPCKTIRIAVSGDVHLNKLEKAIVDTKEFQRLRYIKNLGTTYLVYPSAVHTRFDHSLGTLSMAMEIMNYVRGNKHNSDEEKTISQDEEQLVRLLALLHDIGHIPFGHTLEDEFCIFPRHDKDEDRLQYFLGEDSIIGQIIISSLGDSLYRRFMKIYNATKENFADLGDELFIYDIVNNTVCADLLDYLRRDCYFCNIVLDMDYRFLKYLYLRKDAGVKRLVVRLWKEGKPTPRRDVLSELIRLLDNRYLLGERVYFHHAKLITGAMVSSAVQRAKNRGELKKEMMYKIGDDVLLYLLSSSKDKAVQELIAAFHERRIWKNVYERTRSTVEAEQSHLRDLGIMDEIMKRWCKDPNNRLEIEDHISVTMGMEPGDVLIHCPDSKMAMKLAEMKVFWNGKLIALKDCEDDPIIGSKLSAILQSHKNLWAIRAFINPKHEEKKDAVINACDSHFAFEPTAKNRFQKLFYKEAVDNITESDGLGKNMSHVDYETRVSRAIEQLMVHTSAFRDKETIRKIVKNAFES